MTGSADLFLFFHLKDFFLFFCLVLTAVKDLNILFVMFGNGLCDRFRLCRNRFRLCSGFCYWLVSDRFSSLYDSFYRSAVEQCFKLFLRKDFVACFCGSIIKEE